MSKKNRRDESVFDALMTEVMTGPAWLSHGRHVHLTWLAVRLCGIADAVGLVSDGITALYACAPQKYHATMSRAWVELVGFHAAEGRQRLLVC
jgi:hypothetical protein